MNEIWNNAIVLNAAQVCITALFTAVTLWIVAKLSPGTVRGVKEAWHAMRKYRPDLIAAVDQPTDPAIEWLSRVLPVSGDTLAKVLPRALRALADAFDEVLEDDTATVRINADNADLSDYVYAQADENGNVHLSYTPPADSIVGVVAEHMDADKPHEAVK